VHITPDREARQHVTSQFLLQQTITERNTR